MIPVHTSRRLTSSEERTLLALRRELEQLGDSAAAADCERALAGWGDSCEQSLELALELFGTLR